MTIAVVGKYTGLKDAYKSLSEALVHGGIANRVKVNIKWLDAELFEEEHGEAMVYLTVSEAFPASRVTGRAHVLGSAPRRCTPSTGPCPRGWPRPCRGRRGRRRRR